MSTLIENSKKGTPGLIPVLDIERDLLPKEDYDANSWYLSGSFASAGHSINYMWHSMTVKVPAKGTFFSYRMTFTDETSGYYYDMGEKGAPLDVPFDTGCSVAKDRFEIEMPEGYIRGDLNRMEFRFAIDGNAADLVCEGEGYPLYCAGSGRFGWNGLVSHQYSLPHMKSEGTLTLGGQKYEVSGDSWFDRQWQNNNPATLMKLKWSWMDIRLDCGDIISVWTNGDGASEHTWATILNPDGCHTVTWCRTLSDGIRAYWRSKKSGRCWPVTWDVELPDLDTKLHIVTKPCGQEIYSTQQIPGSCYEGASTVHGTYRGREAAGHCYVEITGNWEPECIRTGAREVH